MKNPPVILSLFFGFIVLVILVVQSVFIGAGTVNLKSAPQLTGQISQILAAKGDGHTLPTLGKDFKLSGTTYLQNSTWAVTEISTLGNYPNTSLAVLQSKSGVYQVALGPGTTFPESVVDNMPADISNYLHLKGAVYVPTE